MRQRFHTLDFLRGVAALTVIAGHMPLPDSVDVWPSLPVDMFFMLSGFVLAQAYAEPLAEGRLSAGRFMALRWVRLYPLYIAGTTVAIVLYLNGALPEVPRPDEPLQSLPSLLLAVALLPDPWLHTPNLGIYPFNPPAWSLMWELIVNVCFAGWLVLARGRWLAAIIAVSLAVLVSQTALSGMTDGGWEWHTLGSGMGRSFFGFFVGVLLFRIAGQLRLPRVHGAWIGVLFLIPVLLDLPPFAPLELMAIVVLFPVLVLLGSVAKEGPLFIAVARAFGALSYPVYVLQEPIWGLQYALWPVLFEGPFPAGTWTGAAICAATAIGVSAMALAIYDAPARRWLRSRIAPTAKRPLGQTAP